MKNLNMDKLSLYQKGLSTYFSNITNAKIKEALKELSYHGEVLERFAERDIKDLELLTVIALDVIIEKDNNVYENQREVFYTNVVQNNLLGEYFLFDFVVSLFDNLYNDGKHNLFKLYIKLSDSEKMFLLNYLFMRKKVTDLKAAALRKIAKEFKPFYTHAQITQNKIEKMYLYALIFNSKSKEYKDIEDFLRGTKVIKVDRDKVEELSIRFGLDTEEFAYVYFITQLLFQDYFKEKTYFALAYLLDNLKTNELKEHLGLWINQYGLRKKMLSGTTSVSNLNTAMRKLKKENLSIFSIFFSNINSILHVYDEEELEKIFFNVFEKENIETIRKLSIEDSYVYFLAYIANRRKDLYAKIKSEINDDKLSILAHGNLRSLKEENDCNTEIIAKAMSFNLIEKDVFVKTINSINDDYNKNRFYKDILKSLSHYDNFIETFNLYFGKENKSLLSKRFALVNFKLLKNITSLESREFVIKETLSYIRDEDINELEKFLLFLYKTADICSKEMFEQVEEAVLYLHDKKIPNTEEYMYKTLNQLFYIEKGKVYDFLSNNTKLFHYSTKDITIDDANAALKPFLLTKDSSIIAELFKVMIEHAPMNQRVTSDRNKGFYHFISEMQKMKMSNKLKKELHEKYMNSLIENDILLQRGNIKEIEEVLNYLKQLKGE